MALNEDLTEAIALGHDLGHTPFGHAGERVLDSLVPGGFRHVRQSGRVVSVLEREGPAESDRRGSGWSVRRGVFQGAWTAAEGLPRPLP
ncbi:hypothetical protein [Desulfuromonas carbonis]